MSEKSCRKRGRDFDMTRAMMLTAVWDNIKQSEVHFQGNAEKGPLVGSLQVFLEVFVFLVTTG